MEPHQQTVATAQRLALGTHRRRAQGGALASVIVALFVQLGMPPDAAAQPVPAVVPSGLPPAVAAPEPATPSASAASPAAVVLEPPPAADYPPATGAPDSGSAGDAAPAPARQRNRQGLGLAGSFATGSGLAYRRYWGDTAVQLVLLGYAKTQDLADGTRQLDSALFWAGGSVIHYVKVWHAMAHRGLLPSTTALRVLGGAHYYLQQQQQSVGNLADGLWTATTSTQRSSSLNLGAGVGFEFGGIVQQGFSLSLDLVLTMAIDRAGLDYILPLPQGAVIYNW